MLARTAARRVATARIAQPARRLASTAAAPKKRGSWKGTFVRWGLAGAAVYYYNTTDIFAEQEEAAIQGLAESISNVQKSELPTIDAILAEKRARREAAAKAEAEKAALEATKPDPLFANDAVETAAAIPTESPAAALVAVDQEQEPEHTGSDIGDLEAEADQQGAFNPETGEINWDCPCLGGMAHGPCGPEFREAFSCFVYSKEEPKGMECIDKFKNMQDCFRAHPDMYGAELEDDEAELEEELKRREDAVATPSQEQGEPAFPAPTHQPSSAPLAESPAAVTPDVPLAGDESGELVPKAIHDAREANDKKELEHQARSQSTA